MLSFLFVAAALAADLPPARVQCAAQPVTRSYWSWREVDGRKCWFEGKRTMPKSQLYWKHTQTTREVDERRNGRLAPSPVSDGSRGDPLPFLPMSPKTLPPWDDPSYWNDSTPFDVRRYW